MNLRNVGGESVVIQVNSDQHKDGQPEIIGKGDLPSAQLLVHQGAIYIHEGRSHQVNQLDLDNLLAIVTRTNVNYYTDVGAETEITILAEHDRVSKGGMSSGCSRRFIGQQPSCQLSARAPSDPRESRRPPPSITRYSCSKRVVTGSAYLSRRSKH